MFVKNLKKSAVFFLVSIMAVTAIFPSAVFAAGGKTFPSAPIVYSKVDDNSIKIYWSAVSGADKYNVRFAKGVHGSLPDGTPGLHDAHVPFTYYNWIALNEGEDWTFTVTPERSGKKGHSSQILHLKVENTDPVPAPGVKPVFNGKYFNITSVSPQQGSTVRYDKGDNSAVIDFKYRLPSYNGSKSVAVYAELCAWNITDCRIVAGISNVYDDYSNNAVVSEHILSRDIAVAAGFMDIADTSYLKLRLRAQTDELADGSADIVYSKNSKWFKFVNKEEPASIFNIYKSMDLYLKGFNKNGLPKIGWSKYKGGKFNGYKIVVKKGKHSKDVMLNSWGFYVNKHLTGKQLVKMLANTNYSVLIAPYVYKNGKKQLIESGASNVVYLKTGFHNPQTPVAVEPPIVHSYTYKGKKGHTYTENDFLGNKMQIESSVKNGKAVFHWSKPGKFHHGYALYVTEGDFEGGLSNYDPIYLNKFRTWYQYPKTFENDTKVSVSIYPYINLESGAKKFIQPGLNNYFVVVPGTGQAGFTVDPIEVNADADDSSIYLDWDDKIGLGTDFDKYYIVFRKGHYNSLKGLPVAKSYVGWSYYNLVGLEEGTWWTFQVVPVKLQDGKYVEVGHRSVLKHVKVHG